MGEQTFNAVAYSDASLRCDTDIVLSSWFDRNSLSLNTVQHATTRQRNTNCRNNVHIMLACSVTTFLRLRDVKLIVSSRWLEWRNSTFGCSLIGCEDTPDPNLLVVVRVVSLWWAGTWVSRHDCEHCWAALYSLAMYDTRARYKCCFSRPRLNPCTCCPKLSRAEMKHPSRWMHLIKPPTALLKCTARWRTSWAWPWQRGRDTKEAVSMFHKAADRGHPTAAFNLGLCHEMGLGTTQDFSKVGDKHIREDFYSHL